MQMTRWRQLTASSAGVENVVKAIYRAISASRSSGRPARDGCFQLDAFCVRRHGITSMKTVSVREFYHNANLVDGLPEGKQLLVTAKGKPKFVVTKAARPRMTSALAEKRSVGAPGGKTYDGVAFLRSLKK